MSRSTTPVRDVANPDVANPDVVVLGGGLIGMAIAWRCAQRGLRAAVLDPNPEAGAWRTAAGMLAPITELHYGETPLLRLSLQALASYPDFAAELTELTGMPTGFQACGTVSVAWDGADLAALRDLHAFGAGLGIQAELVSGHELRQLEPALAAGLPGGLYTPHERQADPRLLHAALRTAADRAGVTVIRAAGRVETIGGRVVGVRLDGGAMLSCPAVVVAAGAWSGQVTGVPSELRAPTRPVKGQTLRLQLAGPPRISRTVRASVKGTPVYLVPRGDGEIVVGASSEEAGFDLAPRAGAVYELLRDAQSLLPELSEATLVEVSTGLRPGSPDNAPIIGESGLPGLSYATGHHRNGVLLTPITANAVADLLTTGALPESVAAFAPSRFGCVTTPVGAS
jgi:glycine oxidase